MINKRLRSFLSVFWVITVFTIVGCGDSAVKMIKNGTMQGYETTTIGKAFDASFEKPTWRSFETDKGEKIVEFSGIITQKLHDTAIAYLYRDFDLNNGISVLYALSAINNIVPQDEILEIAKTIDKGEKSKERALVLAVQELSWEVGSPVIVQWAILADGETFQLVAIEGFRYTPDASMIIDIIYS